MHNLPIYGAPLRNYTSSRLPILLATPARFYSMMELTSDLVITATTEQWEQHTSRLDVTHNGSIKFTIYLRQPLASVSAYVQLMPDVVLDCHNEKGNLVFHVC